MNCEQARERLLQGPPTAQSTLAAHLSICRACSTEAERQLWLADLLRPVMVVAPPPPAGRAALRAALAAAEGALQPLATQTDPQVRATVAPRRVGSGPSLAAYVLAGVVLVLVTGLIGGDIASPVGGLSMTLLNVLRPLLNSPLIWLVFPPDGQGEPWTSWAALIVLAWGLRQALTTGHAASAGPATRLE